MRSKEHKDVKREEGDAMKLFDHHWFFHNILSYESKILLSKPSSSRSTPPMEIATIAVEECNSPTSKPLEPQEHHHHHHHHHQMRWPPLSSRPSLPHDVGVAASPIKANHPTKQKELHRSHTSPQDASNSYISCENRVHHHHHHHHHHKTRDDSRREREDGSRGIILMARKWKSLSDLEREEVRGFEDLGFVFGRGDRLNPILLKVIPGLRDRGDGVGSEVRRPYLSEAWFARRPAPLVINNWGRQRSAVEMKEQLKFWARAVATNVRQEC